MRIWKQLIISLAVFIVAILVIGRLVPGVSTYLMTMGLPQNVVSLIAPSGGVGDQRKASGRRGFGGPTLVKTQAVSEGVANNRLTAIGNGAALHSVSVTPRVAGKLASIAVKAGDHIQAGEVIARLDDSEQKIALEQAQVAYESARLKLVRYENLRSNVSKADLADAKAAADTAKLALDTAQLNLKYRDIVSPISGIAGIVNVELGDNLTTTSEVVRIDDRSGILVDFWVPEQFASAISVGQPVSATAIARPGRVYEGTVEAVDNRIDEASRTLHVRARIANEADELRAGMSFTVTMHFPGDHYPAVNPLSIQWDSTGSYVWQVVDGKVRRVAVRIIQRNPENVLVEAKLNPGDLVVSEGVQRVREGSEVKETTDASGATS